MLHGVRIKELALVNDDWIASRKRNAQIQSTKPLSVMGYNLCLGVAVIDGRFQNKRVPPGFHGFHGSLDDRPGLPSKHATDDDFKAHTLVGSQEQNSVQHRRVSSNLAYSSHGFRQKSFKHGRFDRSADVLLQSLDFREYCQKDQVRKLCSEGGLDLFQASKLCREIIKTKIV